MTLFCLLLAPHIAAGAVDLTLGLVARGRRPRG